MKLSLIIPTYNEKENVQDLIFQINKTFSMNKINGEIIIVDDNSPDKTAEIVSSLKKRYSNLKLLKRSGKLGLSSAVLDGINLADGDIIGVMDADLSHPIAKLPELFNEIKSGSDFVIGSRYIKGGDIPEWPLKRRIMSKTATYFARPFTKAKDPMSGFFMIKKSCLNGISFNPRGFKICLEFLVKAKYSKLSEVPIIFVDRKQGRSKANFKEIFSLLKNLWGYFGLKYPNLKQFTIFSIIGAIGTLVNVLILYFLTDIVGMYYLISAAIAFIFSMTSNFFMNKLITFKEKLGNQVVSKYFKYFFVSLSALVFNLIFLYIFVEFFKIWYVFSQIIAILLAMVINFAGNKIWTFK